MTTFHRFAMIALATLAMAVPAAAQGEWAKGIKYTTSWDDAIAECKATGKLLFIYNGWKKKGI